MDRSNPSTSVKRHPPCGLFGRVSGAAAVVFLGVAAGLLLGRVAYSNVAATGTGYCDYSCAKPPPKTVPRIMVPLTGADPSYYICIPCPGNGGACSEGYATAFCTQAFGWTPPFEFLTGYGDCGACIPPGP